MKKFNYKQRLSLRAVQRNMLMMYLRTATLRIKIQISLFRNRSDYKLNKLSTSR